VDNALLGLLKWHQAFLFGLPSDINVERMRMDAADNECDKLNKEGDIVWDQVMKQVDYLKIERRY
jgi:hypothetical protein